MGSKRSGHLLLVLWDQDSACSPDPFFVCKSPPQGTSTESHTSAMKLGWLLKTPTHVLSLAWCQNPWWGPHAWLAWLGSPFISARIPTFSLSCPSPAAPALSAGCSPQLCEEEQPQQKGHRGLFPAHSNDCLLRQAPVQGSASQ